VVVGSGAMMSVGTVMTAYLEWTARGALRHVKGDVQGDP